MEPPRIAEPLLGAHTKLQWAYHELQDMELRAFRIARHSNEFIGKEENPETGKRVFNLLRDPFVPPRFSIQIGIVVQGLRSCLDHIAYALCVAGPWGESAAKVNVRKIHFPITKGDAKQYGRDCARGAIISMAKPGVQEALDAVQPYTGGAGELLVAMKRLNDLDKHRLLLTVALNQPMRDHTNAESFDPELAMHKRTMRQLFGGMGFWPAPGDPLKAGDPVFSEPLDSKSDEEMNFTFDVALNETEICPVEPVVDLLHRMTNLVSRIAPTFAEFV